MPNDFTRLFWVLLPLGLSREGTIPANTALIRAKVFPMREGLDDGQIGEALTWFSSRDMIRYYEIDGRQYLWMTNFAKYQGNTDRESPSDYPPPPAEWLQDEAPKQDESVRNSCAGHEKVVSESSTDTICNTQYSNTKASFVVPFRETPEQEGNAAIGAIWTEHAQTMISGPILGDFREIAVEYDGKLKHTGLEWLDDMLAVAVRNCHGPPRNPGKYLRKMAQGWAQQGYGGGGAKWRKGHQNTESAAEAEIFERGKAYLETLKPN